MPIYSLITQLLWEQQMQDAIDKFLAKGGKIQQFSLGESAILRKKHRLQREEHKKRIREAQRQEELEKIQKAKRRAKYLASKNK